MLSAQRQVLTAEFTDLERFSRAQPDGQSEHMQLGAGPLRLRMAHAEFGPVTVQGNRLAGTYLARAAFRRDRLAVFFDLGESPRASRLNGFAFARPGAVLFGPGAELLARVEDGQGWAMLTLDRDAAEQALEGTPLPGAARSASVADLLLRAPGLSGMARDLSRIAGADPARLRGAAVAGAVSEAVMGHLAAGLGGRGRAAAPVRAGGRPVRLVGAAVAMLDAMVDAPVYTAEVARELGASQRSLNEAFHAVFGMTLQRYLLVRRLSLARRRMRDAEGPTLVKQVALDVGFWHFGRFALAYRALFGETPSETLARRGA